MIEAALNHLWQSSLFAVFTAILVMMTSDYGARLRFWLWFAASIKFLVPFAALVALGSRLATVQEERGAASSIIPAIEVVMPAAHPFSASLPAAMRAGNRGLVDWEMVLLSIWLLGVALLTVRWLWSWWRLRSLVDAAAPIEVAAGLPVPVKETCHRLEPGLVGILQPTILVPAGITSELTLSELDTVLNHEICHLRHRDNLLAAIQMAVETLLWFFPVVWWLGRRQEFERELACDEAVLKSGRSPEIYANSILKVCELYLSAPYVVPSRISGADLRRRIDAIVKGAIVRPLGTANKLLLSGLAAGMIFFPMAFGLAQSSGTSTFVKSGQPTPGTSQALRRVMAEFENGAPRYELMTPALAVRMKRNVFFAARFLQHLGPMKSLTFSHIDRRGFSVFRAEYARGRADWSVAPLTNDGKLDGLEFRYAYIRNPSARPHSGTSESLRRYIVSLQAGAPNYDEMAPELALKVHNQLSSIKSWIDNVGPLKSIEFIDQDINGMDVFDVFFANGTAEWHVGPLTSEGQVSFRSFIILD